MSMSMTTGTSHRSCLSLLYEMQRHVFTTFTSLLTVSYSSSDSSSWRDDFTETRRWRSWCHAGDNDDHAMPEDGDRKSKDDNGHIMSLYDCM